MGSRDDFGIWVWAGDGEFGYVVTREERGAHSAPNPPIIRKVSRLQTPWLSGVTCVKELEDALTKRFPSRPLPIKTDDENVVETWKRRAYRLYPIESVPDAPLCFPSLLHWLWYLDSPNRGEQACPRSYCADCSAGYQSKMMLQDRCGHPERRAGDEQLRAGGYSLLHQKKRGRPRKETASIPT